MPDNENIDSLIKILEDVGEKELELGVLSNDEIAGYQRKTAGLAARVVREEIPIEGVEAAAVEETDVVDGDLTDLLNNIEIGLTEEKELEEQFRKKEEAGAGEAPQGPSREGIRTSRRDGHHQGGCAGGCGHQQVSLCARRAGLDRRPRHGRVCPRGRPV